MAILGIGLLAAALMGGRALAVECVVADPTGTPLNVRAEPKGRILSVLENGTAVEVTDETWIGGKRWVRIMTDEGTPGWVFAAYLDCASVQHQQKSAPMRPRLAPE
ncbi:MAG TPA: SH3 domain-containing protein [Pararhizobium sp.]|uniref:SH3 domain-containing protein n=1 Tax=Pararhizobium sp. TaxID=1977563 RepID=UPI002C4228F0|nr:SH3 domain-containing protein [Pararhizobium sp.]HTO30783.1 SH3 domain-containing protein [Pararhizobium sp.]